VLKIVNIILIAGTFAVLWWILWFVLVKESPQEDRFIKRTELDYISNCLGPTADQHVYNTLKKCQNQNFISNCFLFFLSSEIKCALEINTDVIARLGDRSRSLRRKLGILHPFNTTSNIPERY
jgi:hypothetical protein